MEKDQHTAILPKVLIVKKKKKKPWKNRTKYINLKPKGNVFCMGCSTILNRKERSLNMTTTHLILTTPVSKSEPASVNQNNS